MTDSIIDALPQVRGPVAPAQLPLAGRAVSAVLVPTVHGGPAGWQASVKRLADVVSAVLLLLTLLPVLLAVGVGVRLSSPGPVIFRQTRVGRHGRHFTMYKFRSFPVEHVDKAIAVPDDECPLPFGRFLRRTSVDELPQLFNVLRGDMSLVGPRPERPTFAEALVHEVPGYRERHRAPMGMTGRAQVLGFTGTSSIPARVEADNAYIDRWTLREDLGILLRTVVTVWHKFRA